jgi:hypothetical protein
MTALIESIASFLSAKLNPTDYPDQYLKTGVNLFLGRTPAEAGNSVVTIYEYEGQPPTFTMGSYISALEHPRIQISVRGEPEDYPTVKAWCVLIRNTLCGYVVPDETYFPYVIRIEPQGIPNPTGYDDINRPKFTMNFTFHTNADSSNLPVL